MSVSIEHSESTTGLFAKKTFHVVTLSVEFSEEEKHIIAQRKLEKDLILERGVPADRNPREFDGLEDVFNLRIGTLIRNRFDKYAFTSPLEAKQYEAKLRELMPDLKAYIMGNQGIEQKSASFEL